jgi:hypothetical protein
MYTKSKVNGKTLRVYVQLVPTYLYQNSTYLISTYLNSTYHKTASNSEPETGVVRVAKKRGRPPKISATQQPTSTEFDNDPPSQPVASSQPVPRYNLRRRQH